LVTDQNISDFGIFHNQIYGRAMAQDNPKGVKDQNVVETLLRELRVKVGLRQIDVATALGAPQSMVSKYEIGERRLDILEIRKICKLFGVSLGDFVIELEKRIEE
jgi:ribosome-binding protein aMBF1 (putative translation factor)